MAGSRPLIVAIDGPAASGKSSTAKAVARELGYRHLDSGAFYRAVTLAALERQIPPARWPALTADDLARLEVRARPAADAYQLTIGGEPVGDRIRSPEVNANVSTMAALPAVRDWLLTALREAGRDGGLVADGRDIGTVVFPEADVKVFLLCAPQERARRRLKEQGIEAPSGEDIRDEVVRLVDRDRQDETREIAPLVRAPDAVVVDTTDLDFEGQVAAITRLARERSRA